MKKFAPIASFALGLLVPIAAFAQNFQYVDDWVDKGTEWLSSAITIIMVLLTVWFLISVFRYIAEKDPGKLKEKRQVMLNSLIGLFVAVSVWGIIRIAGRVFGTQNQNTPVQIVCPPGSRLIAGRCEVN